MSSPSSRERLGLLLGVIGMAIFGGTLPATRIAVSAINPLALTSLRTAIAGLASLARRPSSRLAISTRRRARRAVGPKPDRARRNINPSALSLKSPPTGLIDQSRAPGAGHGLRQSSVASTDAPT